MSRLQLIVAFAMLSFGWSVATLASPGTDVLTALAENHSFPPSFDGHRWVYAWALAGLLAISSLSMSILFENIRFLKSFSGRWREPAKTATSIESLYLLVIVMGFAPDAVALLLWGDSSAPDAHTITEIDRMFDFMCLIPFAFAWVMRSRTRAVAMYQLMRHPIRTDLAPTWIILRPKVLMLLLIIGLSFGVALAK